MKKNNVNQQQNIDALDGFTAIANYISDSDFSYDDPTEFEKDHDDDDIADDDDADIDSTIDNDDDINDVDDVNTDDDSDDNDVDDTSNDSDDVDDLDEKEMITPFINLFSSELGWELEDDVKPKNIKELISFMGSIIESQSKPTYANEEIRQLDEYVRNGGDLRKFLSTASGELDVNNVDLSKESTQKAVIREYLKESGHSEDYINRKITRYEESGTLEEEAEDTVELLKEIQDKKKKKLLKEQEDARISMIEKQQKFIKDVENAIEKMDTVLGVQITDAHRKGLKDYLLKVDAQGRTRYDINYSKDPITRLIQQSFIDLNGDKFVNNIRVKAKNDAITSFKDTLKNNKKNNRIKDQQGYRSSESGLSLINAITSQLMNKNN